MTELVGTPYYIAPEVQILKDYYSCNYIFLSTLIRLLKKIILKNAIYGP